jgi:hypothetical protein
MILGSNNCKGSSSSQTCAHLLAVNNGTLEEGLVCVEGLYVVSQVPLGEVDDLRHF